MVNRSELGLMLAALFSLFNRELTEVDVNAWHLVLGEFDRDELSEAILRVGRTCDSMPPASAVRRAVLEQRHWSGRSRNPAVEHGQRMAAAVRDYRLANPGVTADEVAEFVSTLERQVVEYERG
jgi:hypothetical protein